MPLAGGLGVVHLSLDVVDRMLADVLRGFGSVPKRGAEVGGILMGARESGPPRAVSVADYVLTPIEYRRGPSFLLSDTDLAAFEQALEAARRHPLWKPVGFFRSHTRDAPGLTEEDRGFCGRFFPDPEDILLLVRPYATRVSTAGFVCREQGEFPLGPPALEFPFLRRELDPLARDERPPRGEGRRPRHEPREPEAAAPAPPASSPRMPAPLPPAAPVGTARPHAVVALTPEIAVGDYKSRGRGWGHLVWLIPLAIAASGAVGFFAAQFRPYPYALGPDMYRVGLEAVPEGSDLLLTWDRSSAPVAHARAASLRIEDGASEKTLDLDPQELRTGYFIYRPQTGDVRVRLEIVSPDNTTFTSGLTWRP